MNCPEDIWVSCAWLPSGDIRQSWLPSTKSITPATLTFFEDEKLQPTGGSFARVLAAVPSVYQSLRNKPAPQVAKKRLRPAGVRDSKSVEALPWAMSVTRRVPSGVPSLAQSSPPEYKRVE